MNKAFIDTNILISAIDTTRQNHTKAIVLVNKIKKKGNRGFYIYSDNRRILYCSNETHNRGRIST